MRGITPALFVSHGAPTAALDDDAYTRALGAWARDRPLPRAIVVLSAHAEARGPVRVNAVARPRFVYDFYGFPEALYTLEYKAPGAPDLRARGRPGEEGGRVRLHVVLDQRQVASRHSHLQVVHRPLLARTIMAG